MSNRLADKVAVITGAAGGLGRAYARRLASDGATVAIADVADASETVSLIQSAGGAGWTQACDITDPESVAAFAAAVDERHGRCDILVNNAGIYPVVSSRRRRSTPGAR